MAAELTVALILLAVTLATPIVRPREPPEAVVAVPAAAACVAFGLLDAGAAGDEVRELGPTLAFLAAVGAVAANLLNNLPAVLLLLPPVSTAGPGPALG